MVGGPSEEVGGGEPPAPFGSRTLILITCKKGDWLWLHAWTARCRVGARIVMVPFRDGRLSLCSGISSLCIPPWRAIRKYGRKYNGIDGYLLAGRVEAKEGIGGWMRDAKASYGKRGRGWFWDPHNYR